MREERKLSQETLSKFLGVTRQAYSRYERGEREIGYENLAKLAKFFDVSIDYLLGKSDFYYPDNPALKAQTLSDEEQDLLRGYHALRPDMKKIVRDMINTFNGQLISEAPSDKRA